MNEIHGKSILVRVSARFELARVRVIGSRLYSILSLQCVIGRFSNMAVFGCFVSVERLVAMFWSLFLVVKAKQCQSGSCFLFHLLCEWFFDRFLEKIEVTRQIGWQ